MELGTPDRKLAGNNEPVQIKSPDEFFVTSGTMEENAPSYVPRGADEDLPNRVLAGQYCYVLTSR